MKRVQAALEAIRAVDPEMAETVLRAAIEAGGDGLVAGLALYLHACLHGVVIDPDRL